MISVCLCPWFAAPSRSCTRSCTNLKSCVSQDLWLRNPCWHSARLYAPGSCNIYMWATRVCNLRGHTFPLSYIWAPHLLVSHLVQNPGQAKHCRYRQVQDQSQICTLLKPWHSDHQVQTPCEYWVYQTVVCPHFGQLLFRTCRWKGSDLLKEGRFASKSWLKLGIANICLIFCFSLQNLIFAERGDPIMRTHTEWEMQIWTIQSSHEYYS